MKANNVFHCPLCKAQLAQMPGDIMHPNNEDYGVTVWCPNQDCKTEAGEPCQEVMGHGTNAQNAFDILKDKYHPNKI